MHVELCFNSLLPLLPLLLAVVSLGMASVNLAHFTARPIVLSKDNIGSLTVLCSCCVTSRSNLVFLPPRNFSKDLKTLSQFRTNIL